MSLPRLAWSVCALSLLLVATAVVLWVLNGDSPRDVVVDNSQLGDALVALTFPVVGALIVSREQRNPVGWLFCVAGAAEGVADVASGYSQYALVTNPGVIGGTLSAFIASIAWIPAISLIVFLLLLFPAGTLPSPGWRWATRAAWFGIGLTVVAVSFHPHMLQPQEGVSLPNPLGIEALKVPLTVLVLVGGAMVLGSMVAGLVSLVLRYRRSRGRERLQLKWFTYCATVVVVLGLVTLNVPAGELLGLLQAVFLGPALAAATGFAILRYDLYEIDVVINRTVVYALLTATLGAVYVGTVLLMQLLLASITSDSSLAVAVSTLAVAAAFRPARARIQRAVDRRFYRRKYDAAQTLAQFTARLRAEVDLDALGTELRGVVLDTMQPQHVSLWMHEAQH